MDMISGLRDAAAKTTKPLHDELAAAFSLDGRTAVVTGAAMGIGRQTAITYAQAGATVVLGDRSEAGLAETAAAIEAVGAKAVVVPTDVSVKSLVDDLARAAVKATGRVDVWANVAGIIRNSLIVDTTEEDLDAIVAVNLKGVYWGTAAAGRVMAASKRGSIVNVASAGGEMPAPTLSVYGMTKAGVIQLTRTAAAEMGPNGIRANAVAPGFIETPMTKRVWTGADGSVDEAKRAEVLGLRGAQSPLSTTGDPEDIAYAMLYLAADASKFMTGQVLRPNGGVYMT
ncbi:MAG: short-chain dehydrogenase/reductase [Actinomycetia bacterium]|nr:short-chain dehydrogenase/reductase [Actinomycetes bacterium]